MAGLFSYLKGLVGKKPSPSAERAAYTTGSYSTSSTAQQQRTSQDRDELFDFLGEGETPKERAKSLDNEFDWLIPAKDAGVQGKDINPAESADLPQRPRERDRTYAEALELDMFGEPVQPGLIPSHELIKADRILARAALHPGDETQQFRTGQFVTVWSSWVTRIAYDWETKVLRVGYKRSPRAPERVLCRYGAISHDQALSFARATSKGRWVLANIYRWPYTIESGSGDPMTWAPSYQGGGYRETGPRSAGPTSTPSQSNRSSARTEGVFSQEPRTSRPQPAPAPRPTSVANRLRGLISRGTRAALGNLPPRSRGGR